MKITNYRQISFFVAKMDLINILNNILLKKKKLIFIQKNIITRQKNIFIFFYINIKINWLMLWLIIYLHVLQKI